MILEGKGGFSLRRVGSGKRITLTHAGEHYLDQWMEKNALVATGWCTLSHGLIERLLLRELSCPLNLKDNAHHPGRWCEGRYTWESSITDADFRWE